MSVSVSGLILPKAVFDLHVSVSCLFGPRDADHLSDHVHGKILRNNVSVRFYSGKLLIINSVHTRCIVKTSGFKRVFVKIGDFIKFRLSCGIPREQVILRKSKAPRKLPEKWTFLSLAFYNAPSLDTVEKLKCQCQCQCQVWTPRNLI